MRSLPSGMLNDASILSLRCFLAVVETQSFSSAARQLRVSASSVTKHVQMLETAIGVALVHRTTRRISVTEAGVRFYDQCLAILVAVDKAAAVVVSERQLTGHLRVTAPPSFVATVLGPHIHEFLNEHPGLSVDVVVTSASPNIIRDRIDVAITLQDGPESKLSHILLAECTRVLCASPGYIESHGAPLEPAALHQHDCLAARFSELAEGWVLRMQEGWQAINLRCRLLSDNGDFLKHACLNGAGIANFYRFHVREDLLLGRLVEVLTDNPPKPRHIYAVIPHRQIVRPQARAFIEFARLLVQAS
jgi:DNA-binding transcriptional LysR family regulator